MSSDTQSVSPTPAVEPRVSRPALFFCLAMFAVGCVFLGIAVRRFWFPPEDLPRPMPSILNRNIAEDAERFVRVSKPAPLSGSLEKIIDEAQRVHFDSYKHPLVGQPAPDIAGVDANGKPWSLNQKLEKGPVVVVFYLGYTCNHCVAQLFDVNEDVALFRELGAEVVALSPDTAADTLAKYKQYGAFKFPVLSDPDKKLAQAYGIYKPPQGKEPEDLEHGTFVIDQKGIVRWAAFGNSPFSHNPTLLFELANIQGRVK